MSNDINWNPTHFVLLALLGLVSLLLFIAYVYLIIIACKKFIRYISGGQQDYDFGHQNSQKAKPAYVHHSASIQYYDMRVSPPQQVSYV